MPRTEQTLRPRTVSCGCCTGGCTCWFHKPDRRDPPVCGYHQEHKHPRVTEVYDPAIHLPQSA